MHRFVPLSRCWLAPLALFAVVVFASSAGATVVSVRGTSFVVGGRVTYPGRPVEGRLLLARMANAIFDDANPRTRRLWRYPDTHRWSARRNTREFVAALPAYRRAGLTAFTVNLQGGRPVPTTSSLARRQPWSVSAYRANGSLKRAWMGRLRTVLRAANRRHMVVILGLFYKAQANRLASCRAVVRAVDGVKRWVVRHRYRNVLIEIANESTNGYRCRLLRPSGIAALIHRVRLRSHGRLKASTSMVGGVVPPPSVVAASSFILLHGNHQSAAGLQRMVARVKAMRSWRARPKPIVFSEDSASLADFAAAVASGASWGYYDKGRGNYRDGFQAVPIRWSINTAPKRAFFHRVRAYAG